MQHNSSNPVNPSNYARDLCLELICVNGPLAGFESATLCMILDQNTDY